MYKTKIKNKKINTLSDKRNLKWHSSGEVFGKDLKKKEFKLSYDAEMTRLLVARQIRNIRAKQKLTQKIVAKRSGMPQSVIARVESGDRGVSLDTLGKIANAFGKKIQLV